MTHDNGAYDKWWARPIHRVSERWCDRWVTHDCNGGLIDRIVCHLPSQPWFVRLSDRLRPDEKPVKPYVEEEADA